jgi:hypothetical protein
MADFSADELFERLHSFKEKHHIETNDVALLKEMSKMLDLDLRFTFNPVREASLGVGFHKPKG